MVLLPLGRMLPEYLVRSMSLDRTIPYVGAKKDMSVLFYFGRDIGNTIAFLMLGFGPFYSAICTFVAAGFFEAGKGVARGGHFDFLAWFVSIFAGWVVVTACYGAADWELLRQMLGGYLATCGVLWVLNFLLQRRVYWNF